jgi:hypothetical protein
MGKTTSVTRGIAAAAAMLAGLAVGTASGAWAAPTMNGHYTETEIEPQSGKTNTGDWYFTPCGDGCANVRAGATGAIPVGQARFVNGRWTLDGPGTTVCLDGTEVLNSQTVHFTWDPSTLAGTAQITEKLATCTASAPESWTNNFQLRQAA